MSEVEVTDDDEIEDPVLDKLIELESNDKLDPETVVAEAADPSSPLRGSFEWDDSAAAHQHRLQQARHLIARYRVVKLETKPGGEVVSYRRFTHVESQGRYYSTERALVDWRDEILNRARRDLQAWQLRYDRLGKAALLVIAEETLAEPGEGEKRKRSA